MAGNIRIQGKLGGDLGTRNADFSLYSPNNSGIRTVHTPEISWGVVLGWALKLSIPLETVQTGRLLARIDSSVVCFAVNSCKLAPSRKIQPVQTEDERLSERVFGVRQING